FYRAARKAGLHPIIGVELDGLILLARDRQGYDALCTAVTAFRLEAPLDRVTLAASPHLFVLSRDEATLRALKTGGGEPIAALAAWEDAASRRQAERLAAIAKRLGIRTAAAPPVMYLDASEAAIHETLTAIRLNATTGTLRPGDCAPKQAWFRTPE